ncbi:hypothetical protein HNQ07_002007 [Deinococcus metalli]|uniref:Uncharacterized protein n=1 Tax=Deinococcus metalli TaxID=1141878 RepID=A0A7W8KEZ7_9DEIO|nr:hypothetical protein [Deinococcus metalli]MBB5376543.1 hypothetical protein [Deinococcus metalli]GHF43231.1 hypothetical protein GCM10017781_19580 [Deinococcus metalli]
MRFQPSGLSKRQLQGAILVACGLALLASAAIGINRGFLWTVLAMVLRVAAQAGFTWVIAGPLRSRPLPVLATVTLWLLVALQVFFSARVIRAAWPA